VVDPEDFEASRKDSKFSLDSGDDEGSRERDLTPLGGRGGSSVRGVPLDARWFAA
jgi:hypothetical protein